MPIRWTSSATLLEYPLVSIALGPDPSKSELRGHARAIIAIGDIATGVIAPGGVARAAAALGGLAIGGIVLGGCGIGILALAGLALGCLAMGGLAIGYAAIGGLASATTPWAEPPSASSSSVPYTRTPQAVEYFSKLWPGLPIPPGRKLR